jgi:hypothetical protein
MTGPRFAHSLDMRTLSPSQQRAIAPSAFVWLVRRLFLALASLVAVLAAASLLVATSPKASADSSIGSSVPVSPKARPAKPIDSYETRPAVKPDPEKDRGSSIPVAHRLGAQDATIDSEPPYPSRPVDGERSVAGARVMADSPVTSQGLRESLKDSDSRQYVGQLAFTLLKCHGSRIQGGDPFCFDIRGDVGLGNKDTPLVGRVDANAINGKLLAGFSMNRDLRFKANVGLNLGVNFPIEKAHTLIRATVGPGTIAAQDSTQLELGGQAKLSIETFLGKFIKLTASAEGGKYQDKTQRLKVLAGVRFSTNQYNVGGRGQLMWYLEPAAVFDVSTAKVVPDEDPDGTVASRRLDQKNVVLQLTAGMGFPGI